MDASYGGAAPILYLLLNTITNAQITHEIGSICQLIQKISSFKFRVHNLDNSTECTVPETYLEPLNEAWAQLLLAVKPLTKRLPLHRDADRKKEGLQLGVGSKVTVLNEDEDYTGTVRYTGQLPEKKGTHFGIELDETFLGKGTSNGTFRNKHFFATFDDSAVFKSILSVRLRPALIVGDRVIWYSDRGPEKGTVKWIGELPANDHHSAQITTVAGVEFDRPVGSGTGKYKGQQLFNARRNHASLVPLAGLVKDEDLPSNDDDDVVLSHNYSITVPATQTFDNYASPTILNQNNSESQSGYEKSSDGNPWNVGIGSRVQVNVGHMRYGVIRWVRDMGSDKHIAGIEMEDCDTKCYTDGTFQGEKVFECQPNRSFFVYLHRCQPDTRVHKQLPRS